jgi:hypothetical protein
VKEIVLGVVICAALFVVFGLLPHRGCTGHCAGCTGSCGRYKEDIHHDS